MIQCGNRHFALHVSLCSAAGTRCVHQIVRKNPAKPGGPFDLRGCTTIGPFAVSFKERLLNQIGRINARPAIKMKPREEMEIRAKSTQVGRTPLGLIHGARVLFAEEAERSLRHAH